MSCQSLNLDGRFIGCVHLNRKHKKRLAASLKVSEMWDVVVWLRFEAIVMHSVEREVGESSSSSLVRPSVSVCVCLSVSLSPISVSRFARLKICIDGGQGCHNPSYLR